MPVCFCIFHKGSSIMELPVFHPQPRRSLSSRGNHIQLTPWSIRDAEVTELQGTPKNTKNHQEKPNKKAKRKKPGDRLCAHVINKNISGATPMRGALQFTEEQKVLISAKYPRPAKISVDSTVLKKKNKTNVW